MRQTSTPALKLFDVRRLPVCLFAPLNGRVRSANERGRNLRDVDSAAVFQSLPVSPAAIAFQLPALAFGRNVDAKRTVHEHELAAPLGTGDQSRRLVRPPTE